MFNFITDEHRMIADSVQRVFNDLYAEDVKLRQRSGERIAPEIIDGALADLGLFGADADDMSMSTAQVQILVARAAGDAGLAYPVLETLCAHAVAMRARTSFQTSQVLNTVIESVAGEQAELRDRHFTGAVRLVPFVEGAAKVIIVARQGDACVLARLAISGSPVTPHPRSTVEADYPLHDLVFDGVIADLVVEQLDDGSSAADFLMQRASLLAAAEIEGACRRLVGMSRDYLLTRSQFGQVLGVNQALKHSLADGYVRLEAMSAAIDYAAAAADAGDPDAEGAVCAAKQFAGRAGKLIAEAMLQLHGAVGYTMEFPLHLFIRRIHRLSVSHGATQAQSERLFGLFQKSL